MFKLTVVLKYLYIVLIRISHQPTNVPLLRTPLFVCVCACVCMCVVQPDQNMWTQLKINYFQLLNDQKYL